MIEESKNTYEKRQDLPIHHRNHSRDRSRRMVLQDIEDFTTIDTSIISRATQDVIIIASSGVFTLNAVDASLDRPSLFDEGSKTTDGQDCSRKAALSALRDILAKEDKVKPYTDEDMSDILFKRGFVVARRTVAKYRSFLGIPNRAKRRKNKSYLNDQTRNK